MEIGSAFTSGLQGFQQSSGQIAEATANINRQTQTLAEEEAQPTAEQQANASQQQAPSLESSIVTLTSESNNAQANVRAIETADEVLGSIIDLRV